MSEERIDEFFDLSSLKKQKDTAIVYITEVMKALEDLQNNQNTLRGATGSKETVTGIAQLEVATKKLLDTQDKLVASVREYKKIANDNNQSQANKILEEAKATNQLADAKLKEEKAAVQSAKAKEIEARYTEKVTKEKEKIEKAALKEQKILADLENDYKQLSIAYNEASLKSKNYALRLGENHPVTVQAVNDAKAMHDVLLRLDQRVGQSQRNVGNYASATMALTQVLREAPAFANSFATGISGISNNVPILIDQFKILRAQVGSNFGAFKILAGSLLSFQALLPIGFLLIQTYGKEISAFFTKLFTGKQVVNELRENQKLLNEVYAEGNKAAGSQIADLKILYAASTDVTLSMKERLAAVRTLKSEFPSYFKSIDDEVILNGKAKKSYDDLILSIQASSRAKAAKDKLDTIESQRLDLQLQREKVNIATTNEQNRVNNLKRFSGPENPALQQEELKIKTRKFVALKDIEDKDAALKRQSDFLIKYAGLGKIAETIEQQHKPDKIKKQKETTDLSAYELEVLAKLNKAKQDYTDEDLQRQAKYDLEIINDDRKSFDERIDALNRYYDEQKRLSTQSIDVEIASKQEQLKRIDGLEKKNPKKLSTDERKEIINKKLISQEIINLESNKSNAIIDLVTDRENKYNKIVLSKSDERIRDATKQLDKEKAVIEAKYTNDVQALNARLSSGKISQEDYNKERTKLDAAYHISALQAEIDFTQKIIDIQKLRGIDVSKEQAKLSELQRQLNDQQKNNYIKNEDEKFAKTKETLENIKKIYAGVMDVIGGLVSASVTAQKNEIQKQIDLLDEKTKREIDAANSSAMSEEDKANRIQITQARANAQKEQLTRRQRQLEEQQAKFNKAKTIADIILNTASAIVADLKTPWKIAFDAALGAAQLAIAIATPIPKFFKGTDNAPKGIVIVGEEGRELVTEKTGRQYLTPDGPTYMTMQGGETITTADKTKQILNSQNIVLPDVSGVVARATINAGRNLYAPILQGMDNKEIVQALHKNASQIATAIKNKRENHFIMDRNVIKHLVSGPFGTSETVNRYLFD